MEKLINNINDLGCVLDALAKEADGQWRLDEAAAHRLMQVCSLIFGLEESDEVDGVLFSNEPGKDASIVMKSIGIELDQRIVPGYAERLAASDEIRLRRIQGSLVTEFLIRGLWKKYGPEKEKDFVLPEPGDHVWALVKGPDFRTHVEPVVVQSVNGNVVKSMSEADTKKPHGFAATEYTSLWMETVFPNEKLAKSSIR